MWKDSIQNFLIYNNNEILKSIVADHAHQVEEHQRNAWLTQIEFLKKNLININGAIIFEYKLPQLGDMIDVILLISGIVYILEFKNGANSISSKDKEQLEGYVLSIKNFHYISWKLPIVPILIPTNIDDSRVDIPCDSQFNDDGIFQKTFVINDKFDLKKIISRFKSPTSIVLEEWCNSPYKPSQSIIDAALQLWANHKIDYLREDENNQINITVNKIQEIIINTKKQNKKSIIFINGVPGSGKTLVGLDVIARNNNFKNNEWNDTYAKYLSGNFPLITVLHEALTRDRYVNQNGDNKKTKTFIKTHFKTMLGMIHHFRDEYTNERFKNNEVNITPPTQKIVVFDEAQRCWTKEHLSSWMKKKKGITNCEMSEPESLIAYMDLHKDWSVIVCLIGNGQEINFGEAGVKEWMMTIKNKFDHWDVYMSKNCFLEESLEGNDLPSRITYHDELFLSMSERSFRGTQLSNFVNFVLNRDIEKAKNELLKIKHFPIYLTRDLEIAKQWVKQIAYCNERYGLIASSSAVRLRPSNIWVDQKADPIKYFLNGKDDIRSSFYLEETATEFDVQGLELDYSIVCWDIDMRITDDKFDYYIFKGSQWQHRGEISSEYLKNAYRVILTRARKGMIIYVPKIQTNSDRTRIPIEYDKIFYYLRDVIGVREYLTNTDNLFCFASETNI